MSFVKIVQSMYCVLRLIAHHLHFSGMIWFLRYGVSEELTNLKEWHLNKNVD